MLESGVELQNLPVGNTVDRRARKGKSESCYKSNPENEPSALLDCDAQIFPLDVAWLCCSFHMEGDVMASSSSKASGKSHPPSLFVSKDPRSDLT